MEEKSFFQKKKEAEIRCTLRCLVAVYLFYISYSLYQGFAGGTSKVPGYLLVIFIVFFVLAGIAVILYSLKQYRKMISDAKADAESEETDTKEGEKK